MSRSLITGLAFVSALCVAAGESQAQTYYRYYGSGCGCGGGWVQPMVSQPAPMVQQSTVGQPAPVNQGVVAQNAVNQGTVQSYQRYSYTPAPASAVYAQPSMTQSAPVYSAPMSTAPAYRGVPDTSNYYRGGGYSRNLGNLWEYPKGDPRRQMH